jgi:hypothetical protein
VLVDVVPDRRDLLGGTLDGAGQHLGDERLDLPHEGHHHPVRGTDVVPVEQVPQEAHQRGDVAAKPLQQSRHHVHGVLHRVDDGVEPVRRLVDRRDHQGLNIRQDPIDVLCGHRDRVYHQPLGLGDMVTQPGPDAERADDLLLSTVVVVRSRDDHPRGADDVLRAEGRQHGPRQVTDR